MNAEQFCYWLQGFVELNGGKGPTPEQWKSICEHIGTVFKKVTPPVEASQIGLEEYIKSRQGPYPLSPKPTDYANILEEAKKWTWPEVYGLRRPTLIAPAGNQMSGGLAHGVCLVDSQQVGK